MKPVSILLTTAALIVGLVGCAPAATRYDLIMAVTPAGSGAATDLINASPYVAGTSVSIKAVADVGYRFVNWAAPTGTFANANAGQTTFTTPAQNVTVTANFVRVYDLTMVASPVGQGTASDLTNSSPYAAGASVSLRAVANSGYHFVSWEASAGTFGNATAAQTTFTMPGQNVTVTANFAIDLYFEVDAWASLSGEGTVPPEERSSWVTFQIFTNIVVDSVRVELPDGGSVIVPRYTDLSSPEVDQTTLFRFHIYITGMPVAGGEYVFTGVDMAGEPIPGARNTDVWVGVEPPDPPTNVRAEVTEDGIVVSWDESPIVPGSFEPAAEPQLGSYKLSVHRIGPGEMVSIVYTAPLLSACPGLIPRDKADFVAGRDWGLSLSEMGDGTYIIDCQVHGVAPEGSLGRGNEYLCSDPSQTIIFTIQGGEITIQQ